MRPQLPPSPPRATPAPAPTPAAAPLSLRRSTRQRLATSHLTADTLGQLHLSMDESFLPEENDEYLYMAVVQEEDPLTYKEVLQSPLCKEW